MTRNGVKVPGDVTQLRGFYYAALFKSVSLAAEHLCVTQPAVSRQIKGLQVALNTTLMYRKGQRMHVTAAGEALMAKVGPILQAIDAVYAPLEQVIGEKIKIVGNFGGINYIVPGIIKSIRSKRPQADIQVAYATKEDGIAAVRDGADFFVTPKCFEIPSDCEFIPLATYPIVMIAHRDHPITMTPAPIQLADIFQHELVMPAESLMVIDRFDEIAAQYTRAVKLGVSFSNWETSKRFVEEGVAISIVADIVVSDKDTDLVVVELSRYFDPVVYGVVVVKSRESVVGELCPMIKAATLNGT